MFISKFIVFPFPLRFFLREFDHLLLIIGREVVEGGRRLCPLLLSLLLLLFSLLRLLRSPQFLLFPPLLSMPPQFLQPPLGSLEQTFDRPDLLVSSLNPSLWYISQVLK